MTSLRPIEPIDVRSLTPRTPSSGAPIFEHVNPRTLFVDPSYQRSLSERSHRQIRRIIEGFDWTRFRPPVCALSDDENGRSILKVIDGQHTAIAASSNPAIGTIPIMIVEAPDTRSQAAAFIGQNTDRLGVTATQMHAAAVTAGDQDAIVLETVCLQAGIKIRRSPPSRGVYEQNDTVAVAAVAALMKKEGEIHTLNVLQILAGCNLAPIKADHVKAVDMLLTDPQYGTLDVEALTASIVAHPAAMKDAKTFAATHGVVLWKSLASVWFQKAKKLRGGGQAVTSSRQTPAAEEFKGGGQTIRHHPSLELPDELVRDPRPACGLWAPGNQVIRCEACDRRFRGGPAAKVCARCAYGGLDGESL